MAELSEVVDVDQDAGVVEARTPRRRVLEQCRVAVADAIARARETA